MYLEFLENPCWIFSKLISFRFSFSLLIISIIIIILFSLSRIWSIIYSIRGYWVVIFCISLIICISLIWFSCLLGCLLLLLNTLGLLLTWIVYWLNVYIIRIFHVLEYLLFLSIKYISITILLFVSSTT